MSGQYMAGSYTIDLKMRTGFKNNYKNLMRIKEENTHKETYYIHVNQT
ncbi:hypothetical protein [Methanoplanus limicola]|uniref:Uncharacterized protein n=1 Tax=Methanoplanus limicola DSM 2279 TaxID=937775 RepID=H1Z262_9EURY|nr:hypothetical protein [Methanoplanus limicola]EHQ36407.1 hypothetical protein Metlim_2353 [Methanoplanus limicola DSM 2279]